MDLIKKINLGERLSFEDGVRLWEWDDIFTLGELARAFCQKLHKGKVIYRHNAHLNYSNICVNSCQICGFSKRKGEKGAYAMTLEDIEEYIHKIPFELDEIHITGSLNPDLPYKYYLEMIRLIRHTLPNVHIKAFTAVEIDFISRIAGLPTEKILVDLQKIGLDLLPGGGAEIFAEGPRSRICPNKISGERWLSIHESAHKLGIPTTATMLYGHIEGVEDIVNHLIRLRDLQDKTGGFVAFVPLSFRPQNTKMANLTGPSVFTDIKVCSIARLLLDNFPHIKVYWVTAGIKLLPVLLHFGASDAHGTAFEERIIHKGGCGAIIGTAGGITPQELEGFIREAGYIPVRQKVAP